MQRQPYPQPCRSVVTSTQLFGYGLAFLGVCYYNYKKVLAMNAASTGAEKAPEKAEKLMSNDGNAKGDE